MSGAATPTPTAGALPPGRLNLVMSTNEDLTVRLSCKDASGAVMNLTGYTGRLEWSDVQPRATVPPPPAVVTGVAEPNVMWTIPIDQTSVASFRAFGYTLYMTDPNGDERPWLEGVVTLGGAGR